MPWPLFVWESGAWLHPVSYVMASQKTGFSLALLGMVAVVGVFLITAFNHMSTTSPMVSRLVNGRVPVEAQSITRVEFDEVVGASGFIQPATTISYISPFLAGVREVPVDLGTVVRKGDLLVQFDDREFQAAVEGSLERLEAAGMILEMQELQLDRMRQLLDEGLASKRDVQSAVEGLAEAKLRVANAREGLVQARVNLERTRIVAPMNGIVLDRTVNPNEITEKNQKLLLLGSLNVLTLVVSVGEDKIGSVALGQTASVQCDALPGQQFEGIIVKIDPSSDPGSRVFSAYVQIENSNLRLRPGLSGFARISRSRKVLAIPSMALINPLGDRAFAFVVDTQGRAQLHEIKIGTATERLREVLSGVEAGQVVVTAGHHRLQDGDPVRVNPATAQPE